MGPDGWPMLVVPMNRGQRSQAVTYFLSAGTGELVHQLSNVSDLRIADFNGDGIDDLFYTAAPQGASRMLVIQGRPPETWKRLGRWQPIQDVDGDGSISRENSGEVQPVLGATLQSEGEGWEVVWVSASGRTIQLAPKKSGVIRGQIRTLGGAEAIAGATIRLWPGPFEAISAGDGSFTLEAYTGDPWKILVSKDGYSPFIYNSGLINQCRTGFNKSK